MNQKGSVLIVGIVIGVLIAVGLFGIYYFGTKQSNQGTSLVPAGPSISPSGSTNSSVANTSSWKTYTNNILHFTFEFPVELTMSEYTNSDGVLNLTISNKNESYSMNVYPKNKLFPNTLQGRIPSQKTINSYEGDFITWEVLSSTQYCDAGQCGNVLQTYYFKNNDGAEISFTSQKPAVTDNFTHMLSTFKFTN